MLVQVAPGVAPGADTHPHTGWVPCLCLLLAGHHQLICPLLSVLSEQWKSIIFMKCLKAKSLIQQLLNGGLGAAALRNTSSDTWASSSTQGTCCKAKSICSTVAHPSPFQFTLPSWGSGFCGAGRGDYPAQPCMSPGRAALAALGCLGSKMGVAGGWDKAWCHCHPPCQLWHCRGSGGSGCPDVGGGCRCAPMGPTRSAVAPRSCGDTPAASAAQKLPAPPPAPREVKKHKRERQEGWERWERGREGESPMPGANPNSSRRGISNNNRPWSRPDGFDLITKQGGLGSFRSLPEGPDPRQAAKGHARGVNPSVSCRLLASQNAGIASAVGTSLQRPESRPRVGHRGPGFVTRTEPAGKGEGHWEAIPEASRAPAVVSHHSGLPWAQTLYGAKSSCWSCFGKSRRPPLHPTVAEASHSFVSASQGQGGGSGQCHPVPVPCQRRRLWVRRGDSTQGSNAHPRCYPAPASNSTLGLPRRGWVSAGRSSLHMARIQHLGKEPPPAV